MTLLSVAGTAGACIITYLRSNDLRLERPEWMVAPPPAAAHAPDAPVNPVVGRTAIAASAVKEMADAGHLASAMQESKQTVAFRARALVDAGIAEAIADGMVQVVEDAEPAYAYMVAQDAQTVQRFGCEFLLAIWPVFAEMIRRGDIKLDIVALPSENWSQPKAGLAIAFEVEEKRLSYSLNLQRWTVSFAFLEGSNVESEIFAKIIAASRNAK